ncbi:T9SS type A sorting domain-containing protein [Aquirufa sp. KTFRIE-69F]|uniref:T9SS type A sorting domain-containing protein n=1 Tax=Aquirufa originis TaxID=3096514 RepID=A0ABW6DBF1_9BACT
MKKYFLTISLFLIPLLGLLGQTIQVKKVHKKVIEYAPDYQNLLDSLKEPKYLNRYHEINDFNNDGKLDLFIHTIGNPEKSTVRSLFLNKSTSSKYSFVEDKNYRTLTYGDGGFLSNMSGDFNNDGLMDIFCYTENYHGKPGNQPKAYFKDGDNTPDFVLFNTGKSFVQKFLDTTVINHGTKFDYINQKFPIVFDFNKNGFPEIIYGNQGQIPFSEPISGSKTLLISYEFDKNMKWKNEFNLSVPNNSNSSQQLYTYTYNSGVFNNIWFFLTSIDKYYDLSTKTYLDQFDSNNSNCYRVTQRFLNKIDLSKSFDGKNVTKLAELNIERPFEIVNDWGTHVKDLDNDLNPEIITLEWGNNMKPTDKRPSKIAVYDVNGKDISKQWFDSDLNYDYTDTHANGIHLADLDNDGDIDLVPQNGWNEEINGSKGYNIFLNNGKKFIKTFVTYSGSKTSSGFFDQVADQFGYPRSRGFKIPVDFDKDKVFELMHVFEYEDIDLVELNFCKSATKPILNTSKFTFCASDTLKLSIINSVKGDKYKWYSGSKVDSSNVTAKSFLESFKVLLVKTDSLGCETKTDTLAITKLAAVPTPTIANTTPLTFCAGSNVVLTSSGTNNQWYFNGAAVANATTASFTANAAGTYKVKAQSGDCSSPLSSAATVVVNPIPPIPSISLEANGGLTSSASEGNQWYFNEVRIENATQKTINPTKSGNYTVKVITPCASEVSKPYNLVVTATEETILGRVQVAPNPFSNRLKVSFPVEFGKTVQVKVLDNMGTTHYKKQVVTDGELLDLSQLNGGNYVLRIESNDNMGVKAMKISKVQ